MVGTGSPRDSHITFEAYGRNHQGSRMTSETDGALADSTCTSLHEDDAAINLAGDVNGAMSRDAGDAQARAVLERDVVRQRDRLFGRNYDVLGGRAERAIALCSRNTRPAHQSWRWQSRRLLRRSLPPRRYEE